MADKLERATPQYRMLKGFHVVSDPGHSNLIIIGKSWGDVRERCNTHMGLVLREDSPIPPISA